MIKVVTFFLIFIVVLAMFGRLRLPWREEKRTGAKRCPDCGRPLIGKGPCACRGSA